MKTPLFTAYMCGKLTNRTKQEILAEHEPIRKLIEERGGAYEDPFEKEEGLFKKKQRCGFEGMQTSIKEVVHIDKEMIKQSDILLFMTGDIPSYGSLLEVGYVRYHLVRPVIAIAPKHRDGEISSWLTTEVDYLARDYKDALDTMVSRWGTPEKRLLWRCRILANHKRVEDIEKAIRYYFVQKGIDYDI